jgi:hypothetical protein
MREWGFLQCFLFALQKHCGIVFEREALCGISPLFGIDPKLICS